MTDRHTRLAGRSGETPRSFLGSKQEDRAPSESQKAAPRKKKPVLPGLARTGRALAGRLKWTGWALAVARSRSGYVPAQPTSTWLQVASWPVSVNSGASHALLATECYLVRAAWYRQFPPMSLMPQLFQLPYQRLPSPMQSAFVSSLVAHNPPLGTGAHRPSFPVGQPAGSPGGV
ncbi:hypothetical protein Trihar35433_3019 [Trichoderma harzianum]|nr:hypothetical protein Trihar35433_3019 [Trichoderma harzianum]